MGLLAWRTAGSGLTIEDEGVVLHRLLTSSRYEWDIITAFEVGGGVNAVQPTFTLHIRLIDGSDVRVQEVSASALLKRRTHVHRSVERLNEALLSHRIQGESDS